MDSSSSNSGSTASAAQTRYYLNESDVVVGRIYNEFYVMIIRQMASGSQTLPSDDRQKTPKSYGYSEIAMYKLLTDRYSKKKHKVKKY